jgi:5-methylcytosine-specific restriction endonuclease McrA
VRSAAEKRQRNRARDRERRGGRGYDGISDEQIYRRDKWVCLMPECACPDGTVIDPALAGTGGPWAPSIDHIVPLRDGGPDSARNKRAAHARCNNSANEQVHRELPALCGAEPLTWTTGDAAASAAIGAEAVKALLRLRDML